MRVGFAYDLKRDVPLNHGYPEDALEEYDYPKTVETIAAVLEAQGHSVARLGGGRDFITKILQEKVDLVFNIAEGRGNYRSREAQVPSILEMLDIPYSGSDPQCLTICLDKPLTKKIVAVAGVPTPKWQLIANSRELWEISWEELSFPVIIKPAYEGSSKGIRLSSVVNNPKQTTKVVEDLIECYQQPVMVEEFIDGDEVTVGIIGNSPPRVLGMMRILPRKREAPFVYSLEVKRDWKNTVDYECPTQLKEEVLKKLTDFSLRAFGILGCRDFARLDFRISPQGIPYFIEINPLPGLGDYSDLVIMAVKLGWSQETLIGAVFAAALERYPQCVLK